MRGRVVQGRLELREPLRLVTDDAEANLSGSIGLDRSLALAGDVQLSPQAIERATGGKLSPRGPVPIGVRLSGAAPKVEIELVDVGRAIGALVGAAVRGRLLRSAVWPAVTAVATLPGELRDTGAPRVRYR